MRNTYPHAHYIHCFAHQLNLSLKSLNDHIPVVKLFFTNISGFSSFFSVSPKRTDLLREVCSKALPSPCHTRWNFQTRLISSVSEIHSELEDCFNRIIESRDWDDVTVRESCGFLRLLEDDTFNYLLSFFQKVYYHVDILYNVFQQRITNGASAVDCINSFISTISDLTRF